METKEARASGKRAGAKQRELDGYLDSKTKPRRGLKTEVKNTMKEESFKDEAVFFKYFGDDWDMIKRIAVDPSHQFSNLVKDYLALILDLDSKKFRFEDLTKEQKHGRFKDIEINEKCSLACFEKVQSHHHKIAKVLENTLRLAHDAGFLL